MRNYLEACRPVTTHGVKGEVRAEVYCDDVPFLAQFKTLYLDAAGTKPVKVTGCRAQGQMALLQFEGLNTIEAVRVLVGKTLYFDRADAKLAPGDYFMDDLLGCQAVDAADGHSYGTICQVAKPAAQTIYTIEDAAGKRWMMPAVPEFVKEVNVGEGIVRIAPIPGMFEDAANGEDT